MIEIMKTKETDLFELNIIHIYWILISIFILMIKNLLTD